jgi:alkylated DNA repair dioxygenase AlkB
VLTPRIATINLLAAAQDSAKVALVLKKGDELVFLGQEQDGYLHVSNGTSEGWVRKVLVSKR